jgi:hypothetical protein
VSGGLSPHQGDGVDGGVGVARDTGVGRGGATGVRSGGHHCAVTGGRIGEYCGHPIHRSDARWGGEGVTTGR